MTAPLRTMPDVPVTSYTEAVEAIRARVGELQLRYQDFDDLAGFPAGLSGKVFGILQVKRLGPEKLFDAIRAAGLRFRIEIDPEQTAKMQQRIGENYNPRQANQARNGNSSTLPSIAVLTRVLKPVGKLGGKARWQGKGKKERSDHMKMMINTRWKRYRKQQARRARQRRATHKARVG